MRNHSELILELISQYRVLSLFGYEFLVYHAEAINGIRVVISRRGILRVSFNIYCSGLSESASIGIAGVQARRPADSFMTHGFLYWYRDLTEVILDNYRVVIPKITNVPFLEIANTSYDIVLVFENEFVDVI